MADKRAIGKEKEELAEAYLKRQGYTILERNFYSRYAEIDIIAKDGRYLVFLEVKYRKSIKCGYAAEAVDKRKRQRIGQTAQYYLYKNRIPFDMPCRFDIVAIQGTEVYLIKHAFESL